jgi:hypothetical protein
MAKALPPYDVLRQLLSYDPETGVLTWKSRPVDMFNGDVRICGTWNTRYAGKPALNAIDKNGYRTGSILGGRAKAHRIAWKMSSGEDPNGDIDHINGNREDNRLINLRDASQCENQRNAGVRFDNKSGRVGVWRHSNGSFHAYACGKYIGRADTIEGATTMREEAEARIGFHANHGNRKGRQCRPFHNHMAAL